MNTSILSSTFLLTLLLVVGLFFFIRASVKDRTESVTLLAQPTDTSLLDQLQQHFRDRAYRVTSVDPGQQKITFEGLVRPSLFLATFLSLLAGLGILCLVLVVSMLLPQVSNLLIGLVILAPLAGAFYWQKAGRSETVSLKVETGADAQNRVTVVAHRDELIELQRSLSLKTVE